MSKILIIEDEISINHILVTTFEREGFEVKSALNGRDGLKLLEEFKPALLLLDLMLPDMDGFDICKIAKEKTYVIMITAKSDIDDKLMGIELGADDYITKPFDIREVKLRVKGILRRMDKLPSVEEGVTVDTQMRVAKKDGVILKLNRKEFDLLSLFYNNKNIVFSRENLLEKIWGYDYEGEDRTVDVHIRRLRGKLGEGKEKSVIETIFGVGYVMR
ncbi:MAG: response regulator transcription factor [Sarcina sp.]